MSNDKRLDFDDIISAAGSGKPGYQTWYDRLDKPALDKLNEIKRRWHSCGKKPPAATLARSIIARCRELGIDIAGEAQVARWLRSQS